LKCIDRRGNVFTEIKTSQLSLLAFPSHRSPKPASTPLYKAEVVAIAKAKQCLIVDAKRRAKSDKTTKTKAQEETSRKVSTLEG